MTKNNTVIQDVLDKYNNSFDKHKFLIWLDENKKELLEKEKSQIIDAWNDCDNIHSNSFTSKSGEYYYNKTYNK